MWATPAEILSTKSTCLTKRHMVLEQLLIWPSEKIWLASCRLGNHAGIHSPYWTFFSLLKPPRVSVISKLIQIMTFGDYNPPPTFPNINLICRFFVTAPTNLYCLIDTVHAKDHITCIDSNLLQKEEGQKECVTRVGWFKEICSESSGDMYLIRLQFNQGMIKILSLSYGILYIRPSLTGKQA